MTTRFHLDVKAPITPLQYPDAAYIGPAMRTGDGSYRQVVDVMDADLFIEWIEDNDSVLEYET